MIAGMFGVALIIWPRLHHLQQRRAPSRRPSSRLGRHLGAGGCGFAAIAYVRVRRLVETERSSTIVLFYSTACALLALLTMPFGWVMPDPPPH